MRAYGFAGLHGGHAAPDGEWFDQSVCCGCASSLWLGCMRMVESESVKERKAGARVRLWVKRGNDWVGVGYQDVHVFQGGGRGKGQVCQYNAMEIRKLFFVA